MTSLSNTEVTNPFFDKKPGGNNEQSDSNVLVVLNPKVKTPKLTKAESGIPIIDTTPEVFYLHELEKCKEKIKDYVEYLKSSDKSF